MVKQKRKIAAQLPATNGNDSEGSDYEVEWQVKPTPAKLTKAEQFPLPASVEKKLKKTPGKQNRQDSSSEEDESEDDDEGKLGANGLPTLTTAQIGAILETVKNNKRFVLMVKNLNFTTAKEEIQSHFSQAGTVKGVRIPKFRSSAFAFVEMADPGGFQKAFLLDKSVLDGKKISVNLSESGNKKSVSRIQLLEKKNAEIRKLRKKNKKSSKAAEISLAPDTVSLPARPEPPKDKYLDKPKQKWLTKKEVKVLKRNTSLKAKFKNLSQKGVKA
ncbi:nucleolin [Anopheles darlingi]|uniref:RRM domain-containing protein n=1 Tax=Anopheles darlingi TaxID=43151 RepID=A0A2M4CS70_ANODA|nr:nucleolin [Anopheles darlingi]